jgi:phosphotransferase system enzyme I (PtsI)
MNPQMGMRAIRFCLKEVDIFKIQLRAIWRASALGNIKILFPMISSVDEIREAKKILEEARRELIDEGMKIPEKIDIGAMIEVPSAVVIADKIAREVDFFSIGTNDLIQYSLAIDRANERLTYLYEPLHPAVLRQIKKVVDAAHKAKIEVSMCGEMAGDPLCVLVLLGMELDELSMNHLAIPRIKKIIRESTLKESKSMLKRALSFNTASEVRSYVQKYMARRFPEDFKTED